MHLNSVTRTNPKASAFRSRNDRIGCRATSGNSHTPAAAHTKFIANTDFVEDSGCECVEISDKLHGRRSILMGAVACAAAPALLSTNAEAKTGSSRAAGDFCPPAATDGYVLYTPAKDATPSLRAGVIQPSPDLYSFELPPSWNEGTILNILSGNFCMPRCDEPWYETLWESSDQGSATLIVSPLYRLISKSSATLKDLGTPEQLIERIGPFVTGNYLDSVEDVVASSSETFADGRTYYTYELNAPYGKNGSHQLAAVTIKGDLCYIFVTAASDKQWAKSEGTLRHMQKSFKA